VEFGHEPLLVEHVDIIRIAEIGRMDTETSSLCVAVTFLCMRLFTCGIVFVDAIDDDGDDGDELDGRSRDWEAQLLVHVYKLSEVRCC
jgi:hypothetical protein